MKNNIAKIRKEKKLSQVGLARKIGISKQALWNIETGVHGPAYMTAMKLSEILGCSFLDLFPKEVDDARE